MAKLKELADLWDELGPRVWDFLQNSPRVNTIRVRSTVKTYNFFTHSEKISECEETEEIAPIQIVNV